MAKIKIRPLDDRVVVEPVEAEEMTAGGIVLPETAKEKPQKGTVLAVGPGKFENGALGTLEATRFAGGEVRQDKQLEQAHFALAFEAPDYRDPEIYTAQVYATLLGGGMSSRLFQKIREERGLVYSVYSAVNAFVDSGFLTIYAATQPKAGKEVIRLIEGELRDLRDNGPQEDELHVAKEHLKGSLMLALESTSSRMSNLARQEFYFGRQLTLWG